MHKCKKTNSRIVVDEVFSTALKCFVLSNEAHQDVVIDCRNCDHLLSIDTQKESDINFGFKVTPLPSYSRRELPIFSSHSCVLSTCVSFP
jgi:hypothetical protein